MAKILIKKEFREKHNFFTRPEDIKDEHICEYPKMLLANGFYKRHEHLFTCKTCDKEQLVIFTNFTVGNAT